MKRFLTALLALLLALAATAGALAEGLSIDAEAGEPPVAEVELELVAPNDGEGDDDGEEKLPLDAAHFPDDALRNYIVQTYDMNGDGVLDEAEWDYVDSVTVDGLGVTSLQGIELLHNLNHLSCAGNRDLTSMDLSGNAELQFLNCRDCGLTALNLSGCEGLENLLCDGNPLTALNLENCGSLMTLSCERMTTLASLNLKGCDSLMALDCSESALTKLDVSACVNLVSLCANECHSLTKVNLSGADSLVSFAMMNAPVTALELGGVPGMRKLLTIGCDIKSLDVSRCPALVQAVKAGMTGCDGHCTYFGADAPIDSDIGPISGYPLNVKATTKVIVDGKVAYEPGFSLEQTGTVNVTVGKKLTLNPVYAPEQMAFAPGKVTWTSANRKVATVSGGVVKGVAKGTTTITAWSQWGAKASVKVTVLPKQPTKVKLNKKGVVSLARGKTLQLTATLSPTGAESKLTWASDNTAVATVSKTGKVKARGKGVAVITVTTANGKSAKVTIRVKQ